MSSVNKNNDPEGTPFNSNKFSTSNLPLFKDSVLPSPTQASLRSNPSPKTERTDTFFPKGPLPSEIKEQGKQAEAPQSQSSLGFTSKQSKSNPVKTNPVKTKGQEVVSITYEEIGLFPRSFSRVLDRFLKQIFSDVENLVIQEYRFYRYLFLTTLKCLFILFFVPFLVNILAKSYIVRPLTEYYWNTKQTEIFLNSYQQKRAFSELKEFEEKTYFESLIFPKSVFKPNLHNSSLSASASQGSLPFGSNQPVSFLPFNPFPSGQEGQKGQKEGEGAIPLGLSNQVEETNQVSSQGLLNNQSDNHVQQQNFSIAQTQTGLNYNLTNVIYPPEGSLAPSLLPFFASAPLAPFGKESAGTGSAGTEGLLRSPFPIHISPEGKGTQREKGIMDMTTSSPTKEIVEVVSKDKEKMDEYKQTESLIHSYTMKSSLFVYQTQEADKNIQQRYQEKTIELAQRYNDQSIEAITNFFADLISLFTLFYLLYVLEIQINITKSFLLEVFFGLDDSKKSLLILLITDLLVGYHSSNLWELFFEFLFHHYGLPESQTGIFLLVATLPVLLDVLFKYLIFRHLNRSSPATVATYHAMIE